MECHKTPTDATHPAGCSPGGDATRHGPEITAQLCRRASLSLPAHSGLRFVQSSSQKCSSPVSLAQSLAVAKDGQLRLRKTKRWLHTGSPLSPLALLLCHLQSDWGLDNRKPTFANHHLEEVS